MENQNSFLRIVHVIQKGVKGVEYTHGVFGDLEIGGIGGIALQRLRESLAAVSSVKEVCYARKT